MKCFLTFAVAAALAVGMNGTLWSQAGGGGGAGGGASGDASGGSSAAGSAGAGAAGTGGTASTAGTVGNTNAAAAGATNTNTGSAVGNAGAGTVGPQAVGSGRAGAAATGRTNVNGRANNAAAARNMNRQAAVQSNFQNLNPNQTPFFADPRVRQQLNLSDAQFNTLNTAYQNANARFNQAVNNLSPALTPEQRELQIQQLQQQFNQGLANLSGSTITNPQNRTRFNQLNRQFMGGNAFNDPSIRQQLNLTPAQVRQLRTLQNNWQQQLQQFSQSAGNDLSAANNTTQWNQMWQQYNASLNSVLTPQQQQIWSQQVGQAFPVSADSFMTQQTQRAPDGNVNATSPKIRIPYQANAAGGATTPGAQPQTGTSAPAATQTPTGTQPATQGTSAPATASGTSTQGSTVR